MPSTSPAPLAAHVRRPAAGKRGRAKAPGPKTASAIRASVAPEPDFARLASSFKGMFRGPRDLSVREGYGNGR